jgi:AcrR family transcriptional regulator
MTASREAILSASRKAIARRGVRGLRVNSIAADAGVSSGLLYYYFTDRAGLLRATFYYISERIDTRRSEYDAPGDSPRARLEHRIFEYRDDEELVEGTAALNELRASAIYDPELRAPLAETTADFIAQLRGEITEAQSGGEIEDHVDPQRAALAIGTFMEGLDGRWLSGQITSAAARELLSHVIAQLLGPRPSGGSGQTGQPVTSVAPVSDRNLITRYCLLSARSGVTAGSRG